MRLFPGLAGTTAQFGVEFIHIRRRQLRVVQTSQRPAAGLYSTGIVITHGLELPEGAHALEVANVRAARQMHAVHIGVNAGKGEFGQRRVLKKMRTIRLPQAIAIMPNPNPNPTPTQERYL